MELIWSKDSPCPGRLCQMSKIVFVWVRSLSSSSCYFFISIFDRIDQRNQAAWRHRPAFAKLCMSCFSQAEHHVRSICNLLHSRDRRKYIKVLDINELDELEQVQREKDLHEFCFSCAWDWWWKPSITVLQYPNVCFCSEICWAFLYTI